MSVNMDNLFWFGLKIFKWNGKEKDVLYVL